MYMLGGVDAKRGISEEKRLENEGTGKRGTVVHGWKTRELENSGHP